MQTVEIDIAKLHKDLADEVYSSNGVSVIKLSTLLIVISQAMESASKQKCF